MLSDSLVNKFGIVFSRIVVVNANFVMYPFPGSISLYGIPSTMILPSLMVATVLMILYLLSCAISFSSLGSSCASSPLFAIQADLASSSLLVLSALCGSDIFSLNSLCRSVLGRMKKSYTILPIVHGFLWNSSRY